MNPAKPGADPAASGRAFLNEGDIGSGEKTPGQQETEDMIKEIPPLPSGGERDKGKQEDGAAPKA